MIRLPPCIPLSELKNGFEWSDVPSEKLNRRERRKFQNQLTRDMKKAHKRKRWLAKQEPVSAHG
jgi:hypothetical protein